MVYYPPMPQDRDDQDRTSRILVMGILNVTPDSFFDGGRSFDTETAVSHGLSMIKDGADILDIGGESSRPGADPVSPTQENLRVLPVVEAHVSE